MTLKDSMDQPVIYLQTTLKEGECSNTVSFPEIVFRHVQICRYKQKPQKAWNSFSNVIVEWPSHPQRLSTTNCVKALEKKFYFKWTPSSLIYLSKGAGLDRLSVSILQALKFFNSDSHVKYLIVMYIRCNFQNSLCIYSICGKHLYTESLTIILHNF